MKFVIRHPGVDARFPAVPPIQNDRLGRMFVVSAISTDFSPSPLALLFLAAYGSGMLVRYFPSQWQLLMGRSKGDFTFPLLRRVAAVVQQRFPELLLAELEDRFPGPPILSEIQDGRD